MVHRCGVGIYIILAREAAHDQIEISLNHNHVTRKRENV